MKRVKRRKKKMTGVREGNQRTEVEEAKLLFSLLLSLLPSKLKTRLPQCYFYQSIHRWSTRNTICWQSVALFAQVFIDSLSLQKEHQEPSSLLWSMKRRICFLICPSFPSTGRGITRNRCKTCLIWWQSSWRWKREEKETDRRRKDNHWPETKGSLSRE